MPENLYIKSVHKELSYLDPVIKEKYKYTIKSIHVAAAALTLVLRERYPFYAYAFASLKEPIPSTFASTAFTEGVNVYYNPVFMSKLTPGQVNWVLMHEMLHVLLFHTSRVGYRDSMRWNLATDEIVNGELYRMMLDEEDRKQEDLAKSGGTGKYLDLEVPDCGVFLYKDSGSIDDCRNYSAELLYNEIEMTNDDSANCQPDDCSDCARQPRGSKMVYKQRNQIFTVDQGDLIFDGDMDKASEQKIKSIIYKATEMVKKQRGTECSLLVERILAQLKPSRIK